MLGWRREDYFKKSFIN